MVSKPETARNFPYQSIGARMNGACKAFSPNGTAAFRVLSFSRPTDILPDTLSVIYKSAKEEVFYTGLLYRDLNSTEMYEFVNSIPEFKTPGSDVDMSDAVEGSNDIP